MNLLDELRRDAQAAALLKDWLGEGGQPVSVGHAWYRASVCAGGYHGEPCPNNVAPGWWDKVKSAIADTIRAQLGLRHQLSLSTPKDESLHMCKSCGCCLRLKCHVPIRHIADHTSPDQRESFPEFCWIKRELEQLKQTTQ